MKRLVVCLDGTWKNADSGESETNVQRIARAVSASSLSEGTPQLTLYLRGIGSTGIGLQRLLGGITGSGIDDNIRSAYMFLAQNYVPASGGRKADEIYIFGYSRGAFAARSLCGLIGCTGLLDRRHLARLPQAWTYYREQRTRSPAHFRASTGALCHLDVKIDFLGVWETVGALGVPVGPLSGLTALRYAFHDTELSPAVRRACHAIAIDEHRDEFVPALWTGKTPPHVEVEQVWFAGSHADVGGGATGVGEEGAVLSDIPLGWMAEQAMRAGVVLDRSVLPEREALDPFAAQHDPRGGWSLKDRLTPTYRRICGIDIPVPFGGYLYVPRRAGQPLSTVNESVHPSVWQRYERVVPVHGSRGTRRAPYRPHALAPLRRPALE